MIFVIIGNTLRYTISVSSINPILLHVMYKVETNMYYCIGKCKVRQIVSV